LQAFLLPVNTASSYNAYRNTVRKTVLLTVLFGTQVSHTKKYRHEAGEFMALSDIRVKTATVPSDKRQAKLSDGNGLYLLVNQSGKYWRFDYRFGEKRKTMALGVYPNVRLKEARDKCIAAHKLLEQNIDPCRDKQTKKRRAIVESKADTFKGVAEELLEKNNNKWSDSYSKSTRSRLERHVFPWLGQMKIADIEAPDVLSVIQRAENRGTVEMAHRLKMLCGQVFRYAVATGRVKSDPSRDLRGAIQPLVTQHYATIIEPKKVGELMRAIAGFEGTFVVMCALKITPLVFVRPGELRHAEWDEIDFEKSEWRIPAEKMKMRVIHIVPLARQAVEILNDLQPLTGGGKYVFPSIRSSSRPMSENTVNASLRRIGYGKDEICAHGFRAMASTILHEQGWSSDVIERQLSHKEGNAIKGAYNHARHLPERRKMMQQWADYLDALRDGAKIIQINKTVS